MPRMKWGDDIDELPEEYEESGFEPYDGEEPPAKTVLRGQVKKIWVTKSQAGNDMLKVVFEATGNQGKRAQYDGWSVWDQIPLTPQTAFRYMPFLESLGLTLADLKKRCAVGEKDNVGTPVTKIGTVKFPADISISTKKEKNEGYGVQTRVQTYMKTTTPKGARRRAVEDDEDELDDDDIPF